METPTQNSLHNEYTAPEIVVASQYIDAAKQILYGSKDWPNASIDGFITNPINDVLAVAKFIQSCAVVTKHI